MEPRSVSKSGHAGVRKSEHYNLAGLEAKWASFDRSTRTGVTPGTLFHMATERGWKGLTPELTNGQPIVSTSSPADVLRATLKIFSADALLSASALPRSWVVDRFIPAREVTMLGGDGGTGKTTLALQLGIACGADDNWLGLPVVRCNLLYVSAEDPADEVHYRLEQITKHLQVPPKDLKRFKLIDLAGEDATLAVFDKGLLRPTQLLVQIEETAREHSAGLLIFDSVADFFGGNENDRREVRAFVSLLRGLAMRLNAAVIFLAHPSVDGIKTGRGYSGSTHWNNAVRSRLYFTDGPKAKEDDGAPPLDPDTRTLELAKSNRARRGEQISLFWLDGRFVVTSPGATGNLKNDSEADELFLHLLTKANEQGIDLSHLHSPSFAPTNLAKRQGAKGIGKASLERAMHRLIEQGRIRVETFGPPSKRRSRLVVVSLPAASNSAAD
jgi:RecA-family ATPase